MTIAAWSPRAGAPLSACLAVCLSACVAAAADPPAKLTVKRLFPAGGAAAGTVVVKAEGTFPRWPVRVWTDRGGTSWKPLEEKGAFEVSIAADAGPGVHRVRLHDDYEAATVLRFVVGRGPEISEAEPNDGPREPQAIATLPTTVNGVLDKAGDVDGYGVTLDVGQVLVASIDAHQGLGSPIDAVLEIVDERGGYVARNLDARGLDPRIVFEPRRSGRFTVRVYAFPSEPNSTIGLSGGPDHVYRLTLTTGGFLAAVLPAAVASTGTTALVGHGWNLPSDLPPLPMTASGTMASAWAVFDGVSGAVEVPVVAAGRLPIASGDGVGDAVEPPLAASGCFTAAKEELVHRIAAKKDQPLLVAVEALAAGSEAEVLLEIRGGDGRRLLERSDRDPGVVWTPPEDGDYRCVVRDRRGRFGPGHWYRLGIRPAEPAIEATSGQDAVVGKIGEKIEVPITVERVRGWKDPVEFVLLDPPAGITADAALSAAEGDSSKKLSIVIAAGAASSGPLRIIARRRPSPDGTVGETVGHVAFGKEKLPFAWVTIPPDTPAGDPAARESP